MTQIKVAYQPIIDLLQDHPEHKVKSILPKVIELASAKRRSRTITTFIKDTEGEVVAVQCAYYKRWMPLVGDEAVKFGIKKGSSSGLNPMSADGLAKWSKANSDYKKAMLDIVEKVIAGELKPAEVEDYKAELLETRNETEDTETGFETKAEVVEYLRENDVELGPEYDEDEDDVELGPEYDEDEDDE